MSTNHLTLNLPQRCVYHRLTDLQQDVISWKYKLSNTNFKVPPLTMVEPQQFDQDVDMPMMQKQIQRYKLPPLKLQFNNFDNDDPVFLSKMLQLAPDSLSISHLSLVNHCFLIYLHFVYFLSNCWFFCLLSDLLFIYY